MLEKLMKMKQRKNKGFTLVELIVVLVILGILAALLLPTLTGYIDKAHKEAAVAECRMGVMAAKSVGAEEYEATYKTTGFVATAVPAADITELAEYNGKQHFTATFNTSGELTEFVYCNGAWVVTYDGSGYGDGAVKGATPTTSTCVAAS